MRRNPMILEMKIIGWAYLFSVVMVRIQICMLLWKLWLNIMRSTLQADTDKDGRLSLTEMIENPYVFYSAVFNDEEDDDYDFHDEFR